MRIGIFDSGRGGEFIAEGLRALLPEHEFMVVNDRDHVPYGSRTDAEIISLTTAAIQPLLLAECPIIVIACNTATMAGITSLRESYPSVRFVGIEPMIKPAGEQTLTHHITVLGTPLTLTSDRYRHLKAAYGVHLTIDEPDSSGWASAIEHGHLDAISFDELATSITSGSDTIVLACTHYNALLPLLHERFPALRILEPTDAIARQVARLAGQQTAS